MSIERPMPTYDKRTFYGPLELVDVLPPDNGRYMMQHPDDPSKYVRIINAAHLYVDQAEMHRDVYATQQALKGLSEHGINHVNPSYIDETNENGEQALTIVVAKLNNVQPYEELVLTDMDSEQVSEADQAISNMLGYIAQAINEDGYIDSQMMFLDQFVFDDSQPEGRKAVLVDIDPLGGYKIDRSKDSMEYGYPSPLASTVAKLTVDAITLAGKGEYPMTSFQKAASAIEALPGDSLATHAAKVALLRALDAREISPEVSSLAQGGLTDED